MLGTRERVEARLRGFLASKRAEAERTSPRALELVDAIGDLTLRGGKRLRPVVLEAAYRAVAKSPEPNLADDAGAALEMLQTYLLIHDDWMDLDDERRGGPSVYAALRDRHGDEHLGASLAVLAGDLASAYASELITGAAFPAERLRAALDAFWAIQREVVWGQQLDMIASEDVDRVYDLKTGSYTVRGPARLGALLANADEASLAVLERFAAPLGVAFQVRDELLGTFGDPSTTGKPAGNDLRAGKHTKVVAFAKRALDATDFAPVTKVFGVNDATEADVATATRVLEDSGARAAVEAELGRLVAAAKGALDAAPFFTGDLHALIALLADRDR
ncbi:MAG: polyprenyl synthetase family protein [Polyangiales bacterium]